MLHSIILICRWTWVSSQVVVLLLTCEFRGNFPWILTLSSQIGSSKVLIFVITHYFALSILFWRVNYGSRVCIRSWILVLIKFQLVQCHLLQIILKSFQINLSWYRINTSSLFNNFQFISYLIFIFINFDIHIFRLIWW